jgi:hypothetical protein
LALIICEREDALQLADHRVVFGVRGQADAPCLAGRSMLCLSAASA